MTKIPGLAYDGEAKTEVQVHTTLESNLIGFMSDLVSGAYADLDEATEAAEGLLKVLGIDVEGGE